MEPLDYLEALRRRWALVAAALIVTAVAFSVTAPVGDETSPLTDYSATHTLLVDHETSTRSGVQTNLRVLAVLATSGDIPQRVTQRLGLPESPQALVARVEVDADPKLDVLRISSTGADPEAIAALVDTFADEILSVAAERNEIQRNQAVARAKAITDGQQTRIKDLEARITKLPLGSGDALLAAAERDALLDVYARQQGVLQNLASQPPGPGLLSLGPAVPVPTTSADPSSAWLLQLSADYRARLLIGSVLGMLLGLGLAILIDRLDSRVRSRRQAERAFGLPVIAEIPRPRLAPSRNSRHNPASSLTGSDLVLAEAYRKLAFAVLHTPRWVLAPRPPGDEEDPGIAAARLVQGPSHLVVLTSAAHEGVRSAIVANLAGSLVDIGREVIVVDADHERPRLAEHLGAYADGSGDGSEASAAGLPRLLATTVPGVRVASQASLLASDLAAGREIIDRCLGLADIILVSCPPILSGGEAAVWAVEADAVLVVASSASTTADAAAVTREYLARLQAQALGVVFVTGEGHWSGFARILRRRRPTLPAPRHAPTSPRPFRDGMRPPQPRLHPEGDPPQRQTAAAGPAGNGEVPATTTFASNSSPQEGNVQLPGHVEQGRASPSQGPTSQPGRAGGDHSAREQAAFSARSTSEPLAVEPLKPPPLVPQVAAAEQPPAAEPESPEPPVPEVQVPEVQPEVQIPELQLPDFQVLVPEPPRLSPNGPPRRRAGKPLPRVNLERPSDRAKL